MAYPYSPNPWPSSIDYTFLFSNFWLKTGYGQKYTEDGYHGLQRCVIQVGDNFAYMWSLKCVLQSTAVGICD